MPRAVKSLAQLIAAVRDILDEPVPARWSQEMIRDYLNRCQEDFAVLAERIVTEQVTLKAGEKTISYPEDYLMINALYWIDGKRKVEILPGATKVPVNDDAETAITTGPRFYYLVDGQIEIRPIQAVDADILIAYYQDPPEMSEDDDLPYFNHIQDALVAGAVWMAYRDDNDPRTELWDKNYTIEKMKWMTIETQNYQDCFQQNANW